VAAARHAFTTALMVASGAMRTLRRLILAIADEERALVRQQ
jgi:hypothetical protein